MRVIVLVVLCSILSACAPRVIAPDDEGKAAPLEPQNRRVYERR